MTLASVHPYGGNGVGSNYVKRILVSYDISGSDGALRARVCRVIFGSTSTKSGGTRVRSYRYPGILDGQGARYVGQSVLLLPPQKAEALAAHLTRLGVKHETIEVFTRTSEKGRPFPPISQRS